MRRLTLKTERLNELTTDELQRVAGGAADAYTGETRCWLSIDPCVSVFTALESLLCFQTS